MVAYLSHIPLGRLEVAVQIFHFRFPFPDTPVRNGTSVSRQIVFFKFVADAAVSKVLLPYDEVEGSFGWAEVGGGLQGALAVDDFHGILCFGGQREQRAVKLDRGPIDDGNGRRASAWCVRV